MTKRVLAFLMVIAMVFSLLPVTLVSAEDATPGYSMITQKAHTQTENELAIDVYLQANTAGQDDVTGYQFTVTPAEGLSVTGAVDATGNDGLTGSGTTFVYNPATAPAITVGTKKVLVATITVTGETLPAQVAEAVTLSDVAVSTAAAAEYTPALSSIAYACTDHECGHGAGEWTALTTETLSGITLAAGNYYLTEDVTLSTVIGVAQDAEVTICLNGFDITAASKIRVFQLEKANAVLNVCDCTATGTGADYTSGKLIPNHTWGGAFRADAAGVVINIFGGTIDGSASEQTEGGACIYIKAGTTLNITGGKFVGVEAPEDYGPCEIRGEGTVATISNATFVNCGGEILDSNSGAGATADAVDLTVENVIITDSQDGAYAINVSSFFKSVTIKGDCQFDAPVYVPAGENVTLDLGANAKVTIVTEENLTPETFGEAVTIAGTLTAGALLYDNAGSYVSYKDGAFSFSSHAHDDVAFKVWDDPNSLPTKGDWYLTTDVTLSKAVEITYNTTLNLDLNGHTITATGGERAFSIYGTLNLYDCAEAYDAEGNWTGGVITGGTHGTGGAVIVQRSAAGSTVRPTFNMYGGRISGNGNAATGSSAGAVYVSSSLKKADEDGERVGAQFNMYGGELYNNVSGQLGGAVTVWGWGTTGTNVRATETENAGAEFHLYGGKIHGNQAVEPDSMSTAAAADAKPGDGGAVYVTNDAKFFMHGGEISNNTATRGGAIFAQAGGTVKVTGGLIDGNNSYNKRTDNVQLWGNGGAIYLTGTATVAEFSNVTISNNQASKALDGTTDYTAQGGAIYVQYTHLKLDNCKITGNYAVYETGGAIATRESGTKVTITNSVISGNKSGHAGAGIYTLGNTVLTLQDTTISGNEGVPMPGKTSNTFAAGIYMTTSTSRLILSGKVVIAGNISTNNGANRDLFYQSSDSRTQLLEVNELGEGSHVNVCYNNANFVEADDATKVVKITDGGTQTDWESGWITYYNATSASAVGKNVSYVDTNGDDVKEFTWGHYHTLADGTVQEYTEWTSGAAPTEGGYYYLSKDVTMTDQWDIDLDTHLCFNGNVLTVKSGSQGIYMTGATTAVTFTMEDCTEYFDADGNYNAGGLTGGNKIFGGAMRIQSAAADQTIVLDGGKIFGNNSTATGTGSAGGGVIYLQAKQNDNAGINTFIMNGGEISGNVTTDDNDKSTSTVGGNIELLGTQTVVTINGGIIKDNEVRDDTLARGGVFYAAGGSQININGGQFINNAADSQGGVIFATGAADVNINGGTFEGNSAPRGGVIYMNSTDTDVDIIGTQDVQPTFSNNVAPYIVTTTTDATTGESTTTNSDGFGGAIYVNNGKLDITKAVIEGSEADARGGAIYSNGGTDADINLTNVTLKGNQASDYAGAIYLANTTTLVANGSVFEGNSSYYGGVLYTANSSNLYVTITSSTFKDNYASDTGGALYLDWYKTASITGSTFTGNEAATNGGAVYVRGNSSAVTTIGGAGDLGVTFTGNRATSGAALYAASTTSNGVTYTPTVNVTNATFTGNTATNDVSAVRVQGSAKATLTDCTITGNTSKIYGALHVATGNASLTLAGKMVVTDNVSTNYTSHSENTDLYFQTYSGNPSNTGTVDVSGLTEGSRIGVFGDADRVSTYPVFTNNGGAAAKDYLFATSDRCVIAEDDSGEMKFAKYVDEDGTAYQTVQEAITAAEAAGATSFTMQADANNEELTLTSINYLDLNGKDAKKVTVPEGTTLTLVDTATDDYGKTGSYGTATIEGAFTTSVDDMTSGSMKRYVVITHSATEATATVSAHRVYLSINAKVLRTVNNGVGFKAIYASDEAVAEQIAAGSIQFGIEFAKNADFTGSLCGDFTDSGFTAGVETGVTTPNQKTAVLKNVLFEGGDNQTNAETTIYGRPYIMMNGEVVLTGATVETTLAELATAALASDNADIKTAVEEMLTTYSVTLNG